MSIIFHLGLCGYPLDHSLSPVLHQTMLQFSNLAGDYSLFPVPKLPDGASAMKALLTCMRRGEINGLNITIPHKEDILPYLDELTPAASAIGAVNTVFYSMGKLIGDNTDAPAFIADLCSMPLLGEKNAVVLGAGGAARAVVYALLQNDWQVHIASRRPEQASGLVKSFLPENENQITVSPLDFHSLENKLPGCGLIVNTTPVGMFPEMGGTPWPENSSFPAAACVYDLIYNPYETRLMRDAHLSGLIVRNGTGMLVRQAILAFERWTNQKIDCSDLQTILQEKLQPARKCDQ